MVRQAVPRPSTTTRSSLAGNPPREEVLAIGDALVDRRARRRAPGLRLPSSSPAESMPANRFPPISRHNTALATGHRWRSSTLSAKGAHMQIIRTQHRARPALLPHRRSLRHRKRGAAAAHRRAAEGDHRQARHPVLLQVELRQGQPLVGHELPRARAWTRACEILAKVRDELGVPVLTDVHDIPQIEPVAEVVDVLQTPGLPRPPDRFHPCRRSAGKPVNIKKAQFMAPHDMMNVVDKARNAAQAAGVNEDDDHGLRARRLVRLQQPRLRHAQPGDHARDRLPGGVRRDPFACSCRAGRGPARAASASMCRCWPAPRSPRASAACSWKPIPTRPTPSPTGPTPGRSTAWKACSTTLVDARPDGEGGGLRGDERCEAATRSSSRPTPGRCSGAQDQRTELQEGIEPARQLRRQDHATRRIIRGSMQSGQSILRAGHVRAVGPGRFAELHAAALRPAEPDAVRGQGGGHRPGLLRRRRCRRIVRPRHGRQGDHGGAAAGP